MEQLPTYISNVSKGVLLHNLEQFYPFTMLARAAKVSAGRGGACTTPDRSGQIVKLEEFLWIIHNLARVLQSVLVGTKCQA